MSTMQCGVARARILGVGFSVGLSLALPSGGYAAESFPERPIRIIAASGPGSGPDVVARLLGHQLTRILGQQIVVENRPGAGGNIGADIAARAQPDGYTLLMATANHAIGASLYARLNYNILKDFAAVSQIASAPYLLVVHPSIPANSVKDFIDYAASAWCTKIRKSLAAFSKSSMGW